MGRCLPWPTPPLVVTFEHDRLTPPHLGREVADQIPGWEYAVVPDTGYYGHLESPSAALAHLSWCRGDLLLMTEPGEGPPHCPSCDQHLSFGGFYMMLREDDGTRTCRGRWTCPGDHHWWSWADRPDDPLEPFPREYL
ncbi:hypothetical protein [Nonomuraea sediminis]|uniref:hypothetical protein n=1 Tax=Nonomuraea sediminis TaxID=2835864 RepID=UPI001BDCF094|nr:hypothetical protein [Nonomuraea sediminis]